MKADGFFSGYVNVVLVYRRAVFLDPLLFVNYTADIFEVVENELVNYADDSTLFSICNKPADRDYVAQSINRDLEQISLWCDKLIMKHNFIKTKILIFSRFRTMSPVHSNLILNGTIFPMSDLFLMLRVKSDLKLPLSITPDL